MLGEEEKKHLAIAAVCGAAVGAVAGALGYAAISSRTPGLSRKNSCASFLSPIRQQSVDAVDARPSPHGSGESGRESESLHEMTEVLKLLSQRMEKIEQAVSRTTLSRSASSTGYLTAQEDDSSEEDSFVDAGAESSGEEDIFFHSVTTQKASKQSRQSLVGDSSSIPGEAATPSLYDFTDIDRCLCSDSQEDNETAYQRLTVLAEQNSDLGASPQFLWRQAKSTHQKGLASQDTEAKKTNAFKAKELAYQALATGQGQQISDVHKWCAITIGNIGEYVSIQEKIRNGGEFKERIDAAITLNNLDEMSYYLLGRWCYSVYMMSWVERKVATSIFSSFPSATIDEALEAFQNAERLKPAFWIDNQLHIAKCYIEKRDYPSAAEWLDKADHLQVKPEDTGSKEEVSTLLKKYSSYVRT